MCLVSENTNYFAFLQAHFYAYIKMAGTKTICGGLRADMADMSYLGCTQANRK